MDASARGELRVAARVVLVRDLGGDESAHHVGVGHRGCARAAGSWVPLADAVQRGGNVIIAGGGRSADLDGSPPRTRVRSRRHRTPLVHIYAMINQVRPHALIDTLTRLGFFREIRIKGAAEG